MMIDIKKPIAPNDSARINKQSSVATDACYIILSSQPLHAAIREP